MTARPDCSKLRPLPIVASELRKLKRNYLTEVNMSKPLSRYQAFIAFAVLIAAVLSTATVPALAQRGWQSANFPAPNSGWLVFTIIGDNSACASYNGRDCLWGITSPRQIRFDRIRPLVCGADHREKWGVTGYENPRHWCNLAKRVSKFDD